MLYVITEDKNSARIFWKALVECFLKEGSYEIVPLPMDQNGNSYGGNTTLNKQVSDVFKRIQENDMLFVAFDNISPTDRFNPGDFLRKLMERCKRKKVSLQFTTYYCFEELYISYIELLEMYKLSNTEDEKIINALEYVRNCILKHIEYYDKENIHIKNIIQLAPANATINREHFMDTLLYQVTRQLQGYFKISKSGNNGFGKCWLRDCDVIISNRNDRHIQYFCSQCQYCCKSTDAKS